MKKILLWSLIMVVAISVVATFSLTGCNEKAAAEEVAAEEVVAEEAEAEEIGENTLGLELNALKGKNIGLAQLLMSCSYHAEMTDVFSALADEYGFNLTFYDANFVIEDQISQVEDLISKGSDVLILNPCGDEGVPPVFNLSTAAGIPLFCVDNTRPGEGYTYVGIDNFAIARAIGKYIGSKMNEAKVVYVRSLATDTGCPALRWGGIQGGLSDTGEIAGFDLIDERFADKSCDETAGLLQMEDLLAANDHIDLVIAHRDGQALGAITAIKDAGRTDIKMIAGFDGELRMLEEIKAAEGGSIDGLDIVTGLNSPGMIAETTMRVINDMFLGKSVGSSYYIPVSAISYDNIDEYMKYGF